MTRAEQADAVHETATIAAFFANAATEAGDEAHAEQIRSDVDCLDRWANFLPTLPENEA